ncbi:hypothetical protein A3D05_03715 [Candidatus Gottesmanbacteria bacterium RIFCSPHIGHO2_02_FULL_40_24]|uniref:Uncharacterized protein n=1 Tax=Candidatus Gottesmanbacteria bacterium RIFCSPHIGHO2_01_FULL_40_15 TaxID=1798376 RepID=A0A1F5Z1N9_9BACT|nr:MAG: hypothetical protein A2777_06600 [Candidatus Gottesmanbacteria bacterium RIFCSPHIGHO2_01_FULL_40_15]OGG16987.1 MAG: hypothetical protein A3D05_03715 [Candidatus Gottesmanbacteria bacterium RIFCSPHIGHO2_02_FULL_40_24]OGG21151.1 MAG: hypothetical protein A3B48_03165 [Candidatus Gottesmanbacteria bacterium RIFCSPLOWO2_01_FULL_40_10]OGG23374.1 MAG: hypothetical protein A3E42_03205 [Candidatus Gottesmanbacteria bacterium RIFCSPHIGHO2_12_FULL_40_13]OGG31778.1 MAG: hypothetical protein A3I80_0
MDIGMAPDLRQNIIVTLYLLFSHNYIAFAYFTGIILGIILSIWKPSRFSVFILLGFAVLLFSYEYDKHIIAGLREQTLQSIITVTPHFRFQRLINLFISEILPVVFYVSGWGLVFAAVIYAGMKLGKSEK